MLYRRFGRTELQMSVFSCGGMRYQHQWKDTELSEIPEANQANLATTIHQAIAVGINHIETARGYGTSELQLGQVLPLLPRDQIIVQTKITPGDNPRVFRRQFEISLDYLKLDYVDLLSIHGINLKEHIEQSVRPGGCVDAAQELVKQGRVRFIGFSTHGSTDVIVDAIKTNRFDYVNLHWYYINQLNWPAIVAANALDMGVFIISPSDKGGHLYKPPQKLVDLCHPLSPMVFNDLFCLSHPQIHTLSLGAARPSDFDEHLKVLPFLEQADDILPPILERLESAWIKTVGADQVKMWRQGLPKVEETPGQVNIPVILWLRHLVQAYDLLDYAKARYNMLGNASHWFPGEKVNKARPQQLRRCLAHHPHSERILAFLEEAHQLLIDTPVQRLSQSKQ